MPTANLELVDGTKVSVDGSAEEIARIMCLYEDAANANLSLKVSSRQLMQAQGAERRSHRSVGPMQHLRELIGENYFAERRYLSDVRQMLETRGHIYPLTHLSNPIRRLVVSKELRRLRAGRLWAYTTSDQ
jgi:hypothetical protein